MGQEVLRTDKNGIATLTLNRPEMLNALSPALFVELRDHIDTIKSQIDQIGCVILSAAGRAFSAGNDLKAIQAGERAPSKHFQAETLDAIEQLPQPVIAVIRGHCYTGALELALACDLMLVSDTTRVADTHGKWGMTPTWGMTQRLPRRVGLIRAKEIMFTGRVIKGAECVAMGLANSCVADSELDASGLAMAEEIVKNSWHTLRTDKSLLYQAQQQHQHDGLQYERQNSPGFTPDTADRLKGF
ncbi:MAG: enoyl-CoA hydratase/isomerase family protein [Pseudomonadales bacterium]|nr:enoyl-CoA hydratase/isomerase family protein [Pseudomonadales bacterium]